jgi:hypothetical protein
VFDTDGDGLGDGEEEFATGTDPTDPSDGGAAAEGQVTAEPASDGTTAQPTEAGLAPSCADYDDWLVAQNDYEAAGGTGASASTVESLDPDGDGIACESLMET